VLSRPFSGGTLYYEPDQQFTADQMVPACEKSLQTIERVWGLTPPADLRVYVMTSWTRFYFHAAPLPARVYLAAMFPFWALKVSRLWKYAGGWTQNFGNRSVVGVKPLALINEADRNIGERIFIRFRDENKVEGIACHELAHACSLRLPMPSWLKEGLPMVTVDRYFGFTTVNSGTLETLQALPDLMHIKSSDVHTPDRIAALYGQSYWLTRYLEDTRPGLLKSLLGEMKSVRDFQHEVETAVGVDKDTFWQELRGEISEHYTDQTTGSKK